MQQLLLSHICWTVRAEWTSSFGWSPSGYCLLHTSHLNGHGWSVSSFLPNIRKKSLFLTNTCEPIFMLTWTGTLQWGLESLEWSSQLSSKKEGPVFVAIYFYCSSMSGIQFCIVMNRGMLVLMSTSLEVQWKHEPIKLLHQDYTICQ